MALNQIAISGTFDKSQGKRPHHFFCFFTFNFIFYRPNPIVFFYIKANLVENTVVQPNYTQDLMTLAQQIQDVCCCIQFYFNKSLYERFHFCFFFQGR
jgi:hypothetical protein